MKHINKKIVLQAVLCVLFVTGMGASPFSCSKSSAPAAAAPTTGGGSSSCTSPISLTATTNSLTDVENFPTGTTADYGQSFTLTAASTITSVALFLYKNTGATGNVWIHIESDAEGTPSGTILSSNPASTLDVSTLPTTGNSMNGPNTTFTFTTPLSLSAGTYWIFIDEETSQIVHYGQFFSGTSNFLYDNGGDWQVAGQSGYTLGYKVSGCLQ